MQKWKHISKSNNNWLQLKSTKTMNTSIIWKKFAQNEGWVGKGIYINTR